MSAAAIEVPLFPLNVVLFPGVVMPLHIFEPRYRQMVVECQQQKMPFGVVLARPESIPLLEEPYEIGTIAEIRDLEQLEDGRYVLLAVGMQRFRILRQHREKPYLSGIVEMIQDDTEESPTQLETLAQQVRTFFSMYVDLLLKAANEEGKDIQSQLPGNPTDLSQFIAYFLEIQPEQKQHFLELTSTKLRLQEELSILRREVPLLRQILQHGRGDDRSMLN